jgi:hypothetical protein
MAELSMGSSFRPRVYIEHTVRAFWEPENITSWTDRGVTGDLPCSSLAVDNERLPMTAKKMKIEI